MEIGGALWDGAPPFLKFIYVAAAYTALQDNNLKM
jgi:hypothetical protein